MYPAQRDWLASDTLIGDQQVPSQSCKAPIKILPMKLLELIYRRSGVIPSIPVCMVVCITLKIVTSYDSEINNGAVLFYGRYIYYVLWT